MPTGSAVFDFYGGDRIGNDLFADTLLALDANTGKRIWYFQGVHHDIWDRDFPAAPALVTVEHDGKRVDAVAQTTKQGYVYLFNRATGQSLFPIEEKKYPASTVPGEVASPTQPLPTEPKPYARQLLTADMLTNRTPAAHAWAEKQFKTFHQCGTVCSVSVWINRQSCFRASMAARSGAALRSIRRPASSTSTPMKWPGRVGWFAARRPQARAKKSIRINAAFVTAPIGPALRQHFLR